MDLRGNRQMPFSSYYFNLNQQHFLKGVTLLRSCIAIKVLHISRNLSYRKLKCYILMIKDKKSQSNSFILASVKRY